MYQPAMKENSVRTIYRIKRAYRKPMTDVLEELLSAGLKSTDRRRICSVCQSEGNNADCSGCQLSCE